MEIENLDLGYNGSPSMDCSNGENIRYERNWELAWLHIKSFHNFFG